MLENIKLSKEISFDTSLNLAGSDVLESHAVSIGETASGANIAMMLAHIYAEPLRAAVRETVSNALDATIAKWGNHNEIPQIELSCENGVFSVKDYGVGMDKTTLFEAFGAYFASTKKDDMNTIGAYGLGAKAPLAYTDSFTGVTSRDGRTISFIVRKDLEHGVVLDVLSDETTGDADGTTISFGVGDDSMRLLEDAVRNILKGTDLVRLEKELLVIQQVVAPYFKEYENLGVIKVGGLKLPVYAKISKTDARKAANDITKIFANEENCRDLTFDVGGILYTKQTNNSLSPYKNLVVQAPAGLLSFPSSREHYIDNGTVKSIENAVKETLKQKLVELALKKFGGVGLLALLVEMSEYDKPFQTGDIAHQTLEKIAGKQFADDTINALNLDDGRIKDAGFKKKADKIVINVAYGVETSRYVYKSFIKNLGASGNIYTQGIIFPKNTKGIPEAISKLEQVLPEKRDTVESKAHCVDGLLDRTNNSKNQNSSKVTMKDAIDRMFIKKTDSMVFPNIPSYATTRKIDIHMYPAVNLGAKNNTVSHSNALTSVMSSYYNLKDDSKDSYRTDITIDSLETLQNTGNWIENHAVEKNVLIILKNENYMEMTGNDTRNSDYGLIEKMVETFKINKNNEMPFQIIDIGFDAYSRRNTTKATEIRDIVSLALLLAKNLQDRGCNVVVTGSSKNSHHRRSKTAKTFNNILEKTGFLKTCGKTIEKYHEENFELVSMENIWSLVDSRAYKTQEESKFADAVKALSSYNTDISNEKQAMESFIKETFDLPLPVERFRTHMTRNDETKNLYLNPVTNKIYLALKNEGFKGALEDMVKALADLYRIERKLPPELRGVALKVDEKMAKIVRNVQP